MKKSRRILTVANHLGSVGGSEAAQLEIFRGLADRGWEIHLLYVSAGDYFPQWEELAASTTRIGASFPDRSALVTSGFAVAGSAIRGVRTRPSVVYVHNAGDVPVALGVSAVTGAPVVTHLHLPPPIRQPEWLNAFIRRTAAVIAPSTVTAARWVSVAKLAPDNMSVVPTGVDLDRFTPLDTEERAEVRAGLEIGADERVILFAGRMEPKKGAHFLIDAVRRLSSPVRVILCGFAEDGAYLERLQQEMAKLEQESPGSYAAFLGRRSDVPSLMGAADLVVVPSNWPETQGLVISEAMACGTPVVAFHVGGVGDSMHGFPDQLVAPNDPVALSKAIERCVDWRLTDPGLGPRSREWATEHMSIDRSMSLVDELITKVWRDRG
jgi:glycosyltransferase involved in cell wall biosynthesis